MTDRRIGYTRSRSKPAPSHGSITAGLLPKSQIFSANKSVQQSPSNSNPWLLREAAVNPFDGSLRSVADTAQVDQSPPDQISDTFARISSEIRIAAETIAKIAHDLILLSADPQAGLSG